MRASPGDLEILTSRMEKLPVIVMTAERETRIAMIGEKSGERNAVMTGAMTGATTGVTTDVTTDERNPSVVTTTRMVIG